MRTFALLLRCKNEVLGVILGNNSNELNGLAVCAAGGSNMCLVLPPPTVSRLSAHSQRGGVIW